MEPEPNFSPLNTNSQTHGVPPIVPPGLPPVIGTPPLLVTSSVSPPRQTSVLRQLLVMLLNICLGVFLLDAVVSLLDDSLILFFHTHALGQLRAVVFLAAITMAILTYGLMGLTPMIPKRFFIPVTLFSPVALLVGVPAMIYFYSRLQQFAWLTSLVQVFVALTIICWLRGSLKLRWPLISGQLITGRGFSWANLLTFVGVNLLVLTPAAAIYLVLCATLALKHFSDGFVELRPVGLTVQVREYVRADGKAVQLFPMAHVGDPTFYRALSESFQTNSTILLEGVTDQLNLLTNKITYRRMAKSMGLSEQQEEFKPSRGELVQADVDVEQFSTNTIDFLNLVMLLHARGMTVENVLKLMRYSPPPDFHVQLFEDLLEKRNQHLLAEIQARLPDSELIVVPWGAAHMPGLAREIRKSGFHLGETREFVAIRFSRPESKANDTRKLGNLDEAN